MDNNNYSAASDFMKPAVRLAHGYFPIQQLNEVYVTGEALDNGTIFPELNMPYGMDPEYMVDE